MDSIVSVRNVFKKYKSTTDWVLRDVNLDIEYDKLYFICGPSGVGKSTLLHILGLMDRPDQGEVIFLNNRISFEKNNLCNIRLKNIGFVFQHHYLLEHLTVRENILLPFWAKSDRCIFEINEYIKSYLQILKIEHLLERFPYELSGGEQQRVALARALVNKPKIVIADEPTGNLDYENAKNIMVLIKDFIMRYNITFVVATHNTEILKYGDKVVYLRDGKIV